MDDFKDLVGKTVTAIKVDEPKGGTIIFETDAGTFLYQAEGDCCSSSWFEHVTGVESLIGQRVEMAEEIEAPAIPPEDEAGHDVLCNYGYRLTTAKGFFEIEMRNDSNGYYGGYVVGGEYKATSGSWVGSLLAEAMPLTEDF